MMLSNSSHDIVSKVGYLLGVDKKFFCTEEENKDRALYAELVSLK